MHGRAAMREKTSRLEQRQPGVQSGGDGVRSGRDGGLEPGHGVLGPGQRNEERLVLLASSLPPGATIWFRASRPQSCAAREPM